MTSAAYQRRYLGWTMHHEEAFLRVLGTASEPGIQLGRLEALLRYRSALDRRTEWGTLRREEVLAAVDRNIADLQLQRIAARLS